jgi:uncharacterized MAPEG superfamily protein
MAAPLIALIWFALWAVFLVIVVATWRVADVMGGRVKPNAFPSGEKHGGDAYWRANRAQANTIENLPIFGALVVAGVASGVDTGTFAMLCTVVVIARIVQSLIHMSSGSVIAVNFRFAAFIVQLICFIWIGIHLLMHFYGM